MAPAYALNVRLSLAQYKILEKLSERLQLRKTDVIRFAIGRLAETENLLPKPKP